MRTRLVRDPGCYPRPVRAVSVLMASLLLANSGCRPPSSPPPKEQRIGADASPATPLPDPEIGTASLTFSIHVGELCKPASLGKLVAMLSEEPERDADLLAERIEPGAASHCAMALLPDLRGFVGLLPGARLRPDVLDRSGGRLDAVAAGDVVLIGRAVAIRWLANEQDPERWAGWAEVDANHPAASVAGLGRFRGPMISGWNFDPKIESIGLSIEPDRLVLELRGQTEVLETVEQQIRELFERLSAMTTAQRMGRIVRGDPIAALIVGQGLMEAFESEGLRVTNEPERLTVALPMDLSSDIRVAALTGMVAAVLAPTMVKYQRRSQTAEPRLSLKRMFDGIVAAMYTTPDRPETFTGCPFPNTGHVGMTPPLSVHCAQGPAGLCTTGDHPGGYPAEQWSDARWSELGFQMNEPHRFHYDFRWRYSEEHDGCQFTAQAFGDLDDDGVFSTYERAGAANRLGVNAPGLYIDQEIE